MLLKCIQSIRFQAIFSGFYFCLKINNLFANHLYLYIYLFLFKEIIFDRKILYCSVSFANNLCVNVGLLTSEAPDETAITESRIIIQLC